MLKKSIVCPIFFAIGLFILLEYRAILYSSDEYQTGPEGFRVLLCAVQGMHACYGVAVAKILSRFYFFVKLFSTVFR